MNEIKRTEVRKRGAGLNREIECYPLGRKEMQTTEEQRHKEEEVRKHKGGGVRLWAPPGTKTRVSGSLHNGKGGEIHRWKENEDFLSSLLYGELHEGEFLCAGVTSVYWTLVQGLAYSGHSGNSIISEWMT